MKRKGSVLAQPPYYPKGNERQSPRVETTEVDAEYNPGSHYRQRLGEQAETRPHSRYIHVKQE